MSDWIKFVAIDPSLRNWGMCKLEFNPRTAEIDVLKMALIETENESGKTVRKNSDDLRCAAEIYQRSIEFMSDAALFAAEIPSGTQSARGAMSNGVCLGLLASLNNYRPLVQVSIAEAKKVATGRRTGSKEEMIDYAMKTFPDAGWLMRKLKGQMVPIASNEHLADACAIGVAATRTAEFRAAVAMTSIGARVSA